MRKVLFLVLVVLGVVSDLNAHSLFDKKLYKRYYQVLATANKDQWENAVALYNACYDLDYGQTCVAIGIVESNLGKYMINERTGDYGLTGINLRYYFKDHNLKWSYWKAEEIKTRLVVYRDFAIGETIYKLKLWTRKYGRDYKKVWAHYNGGTRANYLYAKKIYNAICALKDFTKRHKIDLFFSRYTGY